MNATGAPRTGLVLTGFAGGLAVVFAAAFGLGRVVPPVDPTAPAPAVPAATAPAASHPAPASSVTATPTDHLPMTGMTGTDMLPG